MKNFINYGKQSIDRDDLKAVAEVLKSDFLTQGPKVEEFEKAICKYTGAKYCLAVSNGTAALHLAVLALQVKQGSEGITSPNTFVASSNALVYGGLKPVFADIDERTYNIDPDQIKKKLTAKTKVIVPVHFAGQSADMKQISKIAKAKKLCVIEDASHAIGSYYEDGTRVGNCKYSDLTIFSFHPVKTITTGEGGAITTNDKSLYERLLLLRTHGITKDPKELSKNPGPWYYEMQALGFNCRLTDFQSALGISQLKKLNRFIKKRRAIIARYNKAFSKLQNIIVPYELPSLKSCFHLYVVKINFNKLKISRVQIMQQLKQAGIGTQVHYIPVHLQPYYRKNYGYKKGDFPVAEQYYEQCLSLPLYPKMTDAQVRLIINSLSKNLSSS
jgi:UDP-4-amino-4,6-dideoxy-N-acetyl-beta-L-altrosamine transaminase